MMPEMILPGTYIEVRAEGLIRLGPVSISNLGIVGTASRGEIDKVYMPANIGEARDIFGDPDPLDDPEDKTSNRELTLVRALELAYANGAQRVFAVRVADSSKQSAELALRLSNDANSDGTLALCAKAAGSGYNDLSINIGQYATDQITDQKTISMVTLTLKAGQIAETWRDVPADVAGFTKVITGKHSSYNYPKNSSTSGESSLVGVKNENSIDEISTQLIAENQKDIKVSPSALGTNGACVQDSDVKKGLEALEDQDVHIVVIAGEGIQDIDSTRNIKDAIIGHLETSSTDLIRRERIGVIGTSSSKDDEPTALDVPAQEDGRLLYVAPGIQAIDTATGRLVKLPASYTAAAVAGRLSSLDPQQSLTNKPINVLGLSRNYNGTELEQLLLGRVLALESRNGATRVVRGITTSTDTAWSQITTRRIVDYARFGVRASANPFIGKLNNARVRQAMKGSVNSFFADMVDREMLISYDLDVTATRDQEIRGIAQITLVLRPVFSIDYIRVVMYLE